MSIFNYSQHVYKIRNVALRKAQSLTLLIIQVWILQLSTLDIPLNVQDYKWATHQNVAVFSDPTQGFNQVVIPFSKLCHCLTSSCPPPVFLYLLFDQALEHSGYGTCFVFSILLLNMHLAPFFLGFFLKVTLLLMCFCKPEDCLKTVSISFECIQDTSEFMLKTVLGQYIFFFSGMSGG